MAATTDPRSLPLLAADPVALAIAAGRQTQHRQPMKPQPTYTDEAGWCWSGSRQRYVIGLGDAKLFAENLAHFAPWRVGDSLYVRECHRQTSYSGRKFDTANPIHEAIVEFRAGGSCVFRLDRRMDKGRGYSARGLLRWVPNLNMPKEFARTRTKPLTRVWAERVQDISEEDARAEGCPGFYHHEYNFDFRAIGAPRANYRRMMEEFYPGSWERNDWLWCCAWDGVEVRT